MIALDYTEIKINATDSLGELYAAWVKRLDTVAEKSDEPWAADWQQYRQGNGITIGELLPTLPDWVQRNFQHFANINRYCSEVERAMVNLENDVTESYRLGLARGKELSEPNNQEWRECKTAFDRARMLDKIPWWQRLTINKEINRYRSKDIAAAKWPELFTIQNETA